MNAPTTTVQITTAHLCGPLGQALAVVDGQTWIYENGSRRRATANDIRFFFDLGLEVRPVDPSGSGPLTEDKLSVMLEQETRCFQALHDLLLGMDADLDDDLRMRSMRGADRLLADAAVAAFVERRFLRPVEKEKWDVAGARRLAGAERLSVVERLYAIVDGPLLLCMENEIRDWLSGQGLTSVERALEIERAYDTGLVAALTSLSTTALERGPRVDIGETIIEARKVSWDRRLAAHLMERLFPWTTFSSSQSVIKHDAGGGTEKNYLQQLVSRITIPKPQPVPFRAVQFDYPYAFMNNTDQRLPCVLLIDSSGSMSGRPVDELNSGLRLLEEELKKDDISSQRVQLLVVTFGGYAKVVTDWTDAIDFSAPQITANGMSPMGEAVQFGLAKLEEQKVRYRLNGIAYNRPWMFLMTDGEPTDDNWQQAAVQCKEAQQAGKLDFFGIAIGKNADLAKLAQFSTRNLARLDGLKFREMFIWLSRSTSSASKAAHGTSVELLPPADWMQVSS